MLLLLAFGNATERKTSPTCGLLMVVNRGPAADGVQLGTAV